MVNNISMRISFSIMFIISISGISAETDARNQRDEAARLNTKSRVLMHMDMIYSIT